MKADSEEYLETCKTTDAWILYIVRCSDDSLYTGITTDLARRLNEHNGSEATEARQRGAAYTRARRPVTLVYSESHPDRSAASRREWKVKRLTRSAKLKLVGGLAASGKSTKP